MRLKRQGEKLMRRILNSSLIMGLLCLMFIAVGCNSQKEAKLEAAKPAGQQAASVPPDKQHEDAMPPVAETMQPKVSSDFVAQVNGVKLSKSQFDREMKQGLAQAQGQMPAEQLEKLKPEMKKEIIDYFVNKTILSQEVKRLKIEATEPEIAAQIEKVKVGLPPGTTLGEMLKKINMTEAELREKITFSLKVNKLALSQPTADVKPSDKEIAKFYQDNKEKFKTPETVHVRHILIGQNPGDNENTIKEKKAKAEMLRKQLLEGADFATLAKKSSDCPSKKDGGDLGTFPRGQMVKPFEDAAFSQKVNAIGPVVKTDFGYHILQVLAHNGPGVKPFDDELKQEISNGLQRQRLEEAFVKMLKNARAKATIIIAGQ